MSAKPPEIETKLSRKSLSFKFDMTLKSLPWLVALLFLIVSVFMYAQYREASHKLQAKSPAAVTRQTQDTVSRVGKLMILPQGETPVLYTVNNVSKLGGEQFYSSAKNGDITLIYSKSKRAILYRPSSNMIVNATNNITITPAR